MQCERQSDLSTFEISVPSLPPGVVINDPKNVEHVLKNDELFIKGSFFRSRSWDLFGRFWACLAEMGCRRRALLYADTFIAPGNGIINADGDLWKIQRKAGLRFFSNANLKEFIDQILPPYLHDLEEQLDAIARSSGVVDLQELFLELTTRLMGQMAYDVSMYSGVNIPIMYPRAPRYAARDSGAEQQTFFRRWTYQLLCHFQKPLTSPPEP